MAPVDIKTTPVSTPESAAPHAPVTPRRGRLGRILLGALAAGYFALVLSQYPYSYDSGYSASEIAKTLDFYRKAYRAPAAQTDSPDDDIYVKVASEAARKLHIADWVTRFVGRYQLQSKKILEVGAGRGYLQDVVSDYTGQDIAPTAGRFFHKPFVLGSATAMPFKDNSFDAIWSIWVLEHVPNPEQALREIRRVSNDGAVLYLLPAWECTPWAAQGYRVRPYSDFGLFGKIYKSLIPFRASSLFHMLTRPPVYALRGAWISLAGGPSTLHYRRLEPNYQKYWAPDSDAVNSLDRDEMARWFTSRGDDCLSCVPGAQVAEEPKALVVRIHKRGTARER